MYRHTATRAPTGPDAVIPTDPEELPGGSWLDDDHHRTTASLDSSPQRMDGYPCHLSRNECIIHYQTSVAIDVYHLGAAGGDYQSPDRDDAVDA